MLLITSSGGSIDLEASFASHLPIHFNISDFQVCLYSGVSSEVVVTIVSSL